MARSVASWSFGAAMLLLFFGCVAGDWKPAPVPPPEPPPPLSQRDVEAAKTILIGDVLKTYLSPGSHPIHFLTVVLEIDKIPKGAVQLKEKQQGVALTALQITATVDVEEYEPGVGDPVICLLLPKGRDHLFFPATRQNRADLKRYLAK